MRGHIQKPGDGLGAKPRVCELQTGKQGSLAPFRRRPVGDLTGLPFDAIEIAQGCVSSRNERLGQHGSKRLGRGRQKLREQHQRRDDPQGDPSGTQHLRDSGGDKPVAIPRARRERKRSTIDANDGRSIRCRSPRQFHHLEDALRDAEQGPDREGSIRRLAYLPPQRPVIDEILSAVGFRLHAIVEDGPERPQRRSNEGITIILFPADNQVKYRRHGKRIVQTFGYARWRCPTGNPGLKIGHSDRDTGEDSKPCGAFKPRASKENVGTGAIL